MPETFIIDGNDVPSPEDVAMLQALYSRSPKSVQVHLDQVREKGSENFHKRFYVGYGHKSIGDCGTTSIFAENISMLAAKAVQDNPLYNGQEASTRYLDMAGQEMVDPAGTEASVAVLEEWRDLYKVVLERLTTEFATRFPREGGQKRAVWRKAVKARAFDVARGFLPAACKTYVAWHTNLRQAADHLRLLRHHPLAEIRDLGDQIEASLKDRYPSSFGHKRYPEQEDYLRLSQAEFAYSDRELEPFRWKLALDRSGLVEHAHLLKSRPPKTELHQRFRQFGNIEFRFPLDFGSYRDLQRQRSCVQEMPLLTTRHGIHLWYLEQLPDDLRAYVESVVTRLEKDIENLALSPEVTQYYVAMGYTCAVKITCNLPSAVYIAELRSGNTVHPTLRIVAQQMGDQLAGLVPDLTMHHDKGAGVWDIKRGAQDITHKGVQS